MNSLGLLAIATFFIAFSAAHYSGTHVQAQPFHFVAGEPISYANAFSFAFLFSLLFFGFSAPIAMLLEGLRYAGIAAGTQWYELLFALPELAAAYAAVLLGQGIVADLEGKGNVFTEWADAKKFFLVAVGSLALLLLGRLVIR